MSNITKLYDECTSKLFKSNNFSCHLVQLPNTDRLQRFEFEAEERGITYIIQKIALKDTNNFEESEKKVGYYLPNEFASRIIASTGANLPRQPSLLSKTSVRPSPRRSAFGRGTHHRACDRCARSGKYCP